MREQEAIPARHTGEGGYPANIQWLRSGAPSVWTSLANEIPFHSVTRNTMIILVIVAVMLAGLVFGIVVPQARYPVMIACFAIALTVSMAKVKWSSLR